MTIASSDDPQSLKNSQPSSDKGEAAATNSWSIIRALSGRCAKILAAVGEDPNREGLQETPARVRRMYAEMFSGLHRDPCADLQKVFTEKYDEVVLIKDIAFCSMCEHHLLPFSGRGHVGYLPTAKSLG